jgi:hypothetical protein
MPDTTHTTAERVREQIHDLSAGFREVAAALGVPAGIPDDDEGDDEPVDPDDVRDAILDQTRPRGGARR